MEQNQLLKPAERSGGRNGLIELYRFLLALNVVKSHGLFILNGPYFGPGRVSVEFFFVLSGFLFASYLEKSKDLPLKKSLPKVLYDKLKPLFFPLAIGLISNLIYSIIEGDGDINIWGYLWYVRVMIVTYVIFVALRRLIKNDKAFLLTVIGICVVATLLKFFGPFYSWGDFRAASTISLGILLARLPKLKLKRKWPIWLALIPVQAACFAIVCFGLGDLELGGVPVVEIILDVLLYPALVYLTFQINLKSRILNYLGALSFGLYAFQCPADLMRLLNIGNVYIWFGFILAATVIEDGIKRIIKYKKLKNI